MRYSREMLPLAERFLREAQVYSARSIELDPLISALARLLVEHPESWSLATPIRDAIDEAMSTIRNENEAEGFISETFSELSHLGRIFQKCNALTIKQSVL
jgi:hypothetical protein